MKEIIVVAMAFLLHLSMAAQRHELQIGVGYAGADGTGTNPVYDINYTLHLTPTLGLYATYAQSSGEQSIESSIYKDTRTVSLRNTAADPVASYEQWYSYTIGYDLKIVRHLASTLSLRMGARLQHVQQSYFQTLGSTPDRLRTYHLDNTSKGIELGVAYRRQLTEYLSIGGKIYSMPTNVLFGGSLTAAVIF